MRNWKARKVPGNPRVGIAVASFLEGPDAVRRRAALAGLVASFQAQTYADWRLLVSHDGPAGAEARALFQELARDRRVTHRECSRKNRFGHPHRQSSLDMLARDGPCQWLMTTNDDNYYAPVYLEWLLAEAEAAPKPGVDLVYCDMVHSHRLWRLLATRPRYRHLDLGGLLVRARLAAAVKFDKFEFNGDGDWIDRLAAKAGGRVKKVPAVLFVHN